MLLFLVDLINIKKFRISFRFFYSFSFILRSRATSCILPGLALVSWKTKKQATISRSSVEAEYHSLASTVCELLLISYILPDFDIYAPFPIPVWCDNQAAFHIIANPVFHERTKHLDIDCHLVRDHYKQGFVFPHHISSRLQLGDIWLHLNFNFYFSSWGCLPFINLQLEGGLYSITCSR